MNLENKIIIVTGGNGLIGREIIKHLKKNHAVVINLELNVKDNFEAGTLLCDVTDKKSVDSTIKKVLSKYKKIDGLVNNAYPRTKDWGVAFENISIKSWKQNIDLQLNSCFYITQQIIEIMKKQNFGSVVNMASIYGIVGNDFTIYENTGGLTSPAAYSAIKGGIINFTRYLASYYGGNNIRVNCISPGGVINEQNENFIKQYESKVPLKRMARSEEIAPAVTFLLSEESSYITGHNLVIDGGWTAI